MPPVARRGVPSHPQVTRSGGPCEGHLGVTWGDLGVICGDLGALCFQTRVPIRLKAAALSFAPAERRTVQMRTINSDSLTQVTPQVNPKSPPSHPSHPQVNLTGGPLTG